jgi:hypothetical protein
MAYQPAACSHIVTVYILYKFHNNLGSSVYHLLFLHARPANQPTIMGLALCRKKRFVVHYLDLKQKDGKLHTA